MKPLSQGFLGSFTRGLSKLQRGVSFVLEGSCCFHGLKILNLIPFFSCLPVEWREVGKRLPLVRLGVRRGPVGIAHCEQPSRSYICGGIEIL